MAAAGAIASVPLGADVAAGTPMDLVRQAEEIFRTRDPDYTCRSYPVEMSVAGETRIIESGRRRMGPYEIFVRHGSTRGRPGSDECVAVERIGKCPETAAHTSAQLLDDEGIEIERPQRVVPSHRFTNGSDA